MSPAAFDEAPYVAWAVESAPVIAKATLGAAVLERCVAETQRAAIRQRTDPGWVADYRRACPVPGASAEAFLLRECALVGDARLLAGIHFYGGDVAKPFVGVLAQTRTLTAQARLAATEAPCDASAAFAPAAVWWWVPGDAGTTDAEGRIVADQRVLIGSIPELVRAGSGVAEVSFVLRHDESGASYGQYTRLFDTFVTANPAWRGRLARSGRADSEACAGAGGLFVAERAGRMAGVFAARPGDVHGIPGWLVEEELLGDALRGRGLAPTLQRMAIARLDTSERRLVLATRRACTSDGAAGTHAERHEDVRWDDVRATRGASGGALVARAHGGDRRRARRRRT